MARIIVHIDLNAFFVTVETLRDPSLKGKPVIVGHTGRSGIVSTCSYEARAYGVHSGQPTFQALKLCPNAILVDPHYSDYELYSRSFFSYLKEYVSQIEMASIDECYADFTKPLSKEKDPIAYLKKMQFDLREKTGLSCSIGVAATKWLAKMGSDLKKPMGLVILHRSDLPSTIYPLPIEQFWGIGKKTAPRLREQGILTIGDLAAKCEKDDPALMKELGKFYYTVKEWVFGQGSDQIETTPADPKSVGVSHTLFHDSQGLVEVRRTLMDLCKEVESRAAKENKIGRGMTLHVKDVSFRLHSKSATFEEPTRSAEVLFAKACALYSAFEEMEVRLVGVTLEKLEKPSHVQVQMTIWNYQEYEEKDKTKLLIAELNRKLKKPSITRMSEAKKRRKKK